MNGQILKSQFFELKQAADKALKEKDFSEALFLYDLAVKIEPDNAELYKCLGRVYQDQNMVEQAKKYYLQAIEMDGSYWAAYHNLGVIAESKKDFEMAINYYKKAFSCNDEQCLSLLCLGNLYGELRQYILAQYYFQKASQIAPSNYDVSYLQAYLLLKRKKYESAIVLFESILNIMPLKRLPFIYEYLATACQKLPNTHEKAIMYYEEYIKVSVSGSEKCMAYGYIILLYNQLEKYEEAIAYWHLSITDLSNTLDEFEKLNWLATLFWVREVSPLLNSGIKAFIEYALLHPKSSLVHYFLAFCYNTKGEYQKATKHASISIAIDCTHPRAYYQLAQACFYRACEDKSLLAKSIQTLQKMIEIDPIDHYEGYELLAKIYRVQNEKSKAHIAERRNEQLRDSRAKSISTSKNLRVGEFR
jgi:tetratricopeptide (TPR) repeat protein